MLTCYFPPTSGEITVRDLNIHDDAGRIKEMIGYLPESAPIYPDMLVFDYLLFVAGLRKLSADRKIGRIRELARLCGLNEVMHKPIHDLSKGYKQRVGLAHAMMGDPEILVLDEPTSGLDPNQIVEIREIIRQIGREKTVILSTHILSEAEATCDRVVIINQGEIAADGSTEALKESAAGEYTVHISLQGADPEQVRQAFTGIPDVDAPALEESGNATLDFTLTCRTAKDLRPTLYDIIRREGWDLLEFHRRTRTLESIFRQLTKKEG